jgi:hypothetical protein
MLVGTMQPPGTFKIHRRRRAETSVADPLACMNTRAQRIVDSLRDEILEGGENLRIRQVFQEPRAIYRIELDVPDLNYQRTTLLDEDALEELLEIDEIRSRVADAISF